MFVRLLHSVKEVKRTVGMGAIKGVRKVLVNTQVNDWALTGAVREWIYKHTNSDGVVEVEYFDVKLRVPGHDTGLAPGLVGGYYEKLQLGVYERLSKDAKVIVDVGANIGLYSAIGAKNMKSGGKLFAFEPIPTNSKLLRSNLELNNLSDKVKIAPYAVGEDNRKLELYISEKSGGNHSAGGFGESGYTDVLEVKQTSIDAYVVRTGIDKVDLMKVDVEGYDGYVLKGSLKTITQSQPALMIECIPKLLKRCDFDFNEFGRILFESYKYCYSIDEANGKILQIDATDLQGYLNKIGNTNLVLVNRASHKKIIESFMGH